MEPHMIGPVMVKRVFQSAIVLFLLVTVLFFISRMSGDPVLMLTEGAIEPEEIDKLRAAYGFDRPIIVQFASFLLEIARGDFGESVRTFEPASEMVKSRVGISLRMVVPAFMTYIFLSIPIGCLAAVKRGAIGAFAMVISLVGQSVPSFFLGILYIYFFGVTLRWLPVFGSGSWEHYVLPIATLCGYPLAKYTRLVRAQVSETLTMEFVRTARAKGLHEVNVIRRHVLRNALLPVITTMGVDVGTLIGSALIVEAIFAWPGFGTLVVEAAKTRDYPIIQTAGLLIGFLVLTGSIVADFAYGLIDPRIRRSA
ncbi:MAG: peptide/nickel transport system permease protein [Chloroflexi bacterium]|jgi:peptide/nickel transport system permease protein|nr:MAG: peptide/nickel transport system permease protein [Chloroflexota bacterium]|tara:strand:- start:4727 stop:5659 length:933 start_codon:yes stop_codon:yes gene_type:complete